MITPERLEQIPYKPMRITSSLQNDIIEYISSDLGDFDNFNILEEYEQSKQANINRFNKYYNNKVAQSRDKLNAEIEALIVSIIISNMISKTAKEYITFEKDDYLQKITNDAIKQTQTNINDMLNNLGFSNPVNGKMKFTPIRPTEYKPIYPNSGFYQRLTDKVAEDIFTGKQDYNTAIKKAVNTMTNRGLRVWNRANGKSEQINTATRRHVMTQVKQLSHLQTEYQAKKLGLTTFEVTYHSGHRPSHGWGGRRYSTVKTDEIDEQTGKPFLLREEMFEKYGGGTLEDWNCYHDIFYIYPNDYPIYSEKKLKELDKKEQDVKKYKDKEFTHYEAKQKQRQYEMKMRSLRLAADCYKKAGLDEDYMLAKINYQRTRQQYTAFSNKMKILTEHERVTYDGLGRDNKNITKNIINITAQSGIKVTDISNHALDRISERGLKYSSIKDALETPIHIGNLEIKSNRPSIRYVGNEITVNINPEKGNIATVWKTGKRTLKKYGG